MIFLFIEILSLPNSELAKMKSLALISSIGLFFDRGVLVKTSRNLKRQFTRFEKVQKALNLLKTLHSFDMV